MVRTQVRICTLSSCVVCLCVGLRTKQSRPSLLRNDNDIQTERDRCDWRRSARSPISFAFYETYKEYMHYTQGATAKERRSRLSVQTCSVETEDKKSGTAFMRLGPFHTSGGEFHAVSVKSSMFHELAPRNAIGYYLTPVDKDGVPMGNPPLINHHSILTTQPYEAPAINGYDIDTCPSPRSQNMLMCHYKDLSSHPFRGAGLHTLNLAPLWGFGGLYGDGRTNGSVQLEWYVEAGVRWSDKKSIDKTGTILFKSPGFQSTDGTDASGNLRFNSIYKSKFEEDYILFFSHVFSESGTFSDCQLHRHGGLYLSEIWMVAGTQKDLGFGSLPGMEERSIWEPYYPKEHGTNLSASLQHLETNIGNVRTLCRISLPLSQTMQLEEDHQWYVRQTTLGCEPFHYEKGEVVTSVYIYRSTKSLNIARQGLEIGPNGDYADEHSWHGCVLSPDDEHAGSSITSSLVRSLFHDKLELTSWGGTGSMCYGMRRKIVDPDVTAVAFKNGDKKSCWAVCGKDADACEDVSAPGFHTSSLQNALQNFTPL